MKTVIVYGPQGCGKTNNKDILLKHFNLDRCVDEFKQSDILEENTLYLTNVPVVGAFDYFSVINAIKSRQLPDLQVSPA